VTVYPSKTRFTCCWKTAIKHWKLQSKIWSEKNERHFCTCWEILYKNCRCQCQSRIFSV